MRTAASPSRKKVGIVTLGVSSGWYAGTFCWYHGLFDGRRLSSLSFSGAAATSTPAMMKTNASWPCFQSGQNRRVEVPHTLPLPNNRKSQDFLNRLEDRLKDCIFEGRK